MEIDQPERRLHKKKQLSPKNLEHENSMLMSLFREKVSSTADVQIVFRYFSKVKTLVERRKTQCTSFAENSILSRK